MLAMTTVADPDEQLSAVDPSQAQIELMERYSAHNYHPLPVVIADGRGRLGDRRRGQALPRHAGRLLGAELRPPPPRPGRRRARAARPAHAHLPRVPQRPVRPRSASELAELCRHGHGAADEHRRRGGRDRDQGRPQVGLRGQGRAGRTARRSSSADGNFHGRTITIVELLDRPGRARRLRPVHARVRDRARTATSTRCAAAIDDDTVAVPARADPGRGRASSCRPTGYLRARARALHRAQRAAHRRRDPVRPRPHRARRSPCEHEGVVPDVYILGKALGGGIVPVVGRGVRPARCSGVFRPGEHGSTFGGNPLACAVGLEVVRLLRDRRVPAARRPSWATALLERLPRRGSAGSRERGPRPGPVGRHRPRARGGAGPRGVRTARSSMGVLAKDTHETTIRLAPPLCVTQEDLDWATERILEALRERVA